MRCKAALVSCLTFTILTQLLLAPGRKLTLQWLREEGGYDWKGPECIDAKAESEASLACFRRP